MVGGNLCATLTALTCPSLISAGIQAPSGNEIPLLEQVWVSTVLLSNCFVGVFRVTPLLSNNSSGSSKMGFPGLRIRGFWVF